MRPVVAEAIESLHAAFHEEQARRRGRRMHARRLDDAGLGEEAAAAWREVVDRDPACGEAWAALSDWHRAHHRFSEALGAAIKSLRVDPLRGEGHVSIGFLLREDTVASEARRAYDIATAGSDRSGGEADSASRDVLVRRGNRQLAALDPTAAINTFNEALAVAPSDPVVAANLGVAFALAGDRLRAALWRGSAAFSEADYDTSVELWSPLLDRDVASAALFVSTGDSYRALKQDAAALRVFDEGCRRWPTEATLWLRAWRTLLALGRPAAAIRCARRGIRSCPASLVLKRARYLTLPAVYAHEGQITRCRRHFAQGLERLVAETRLDTEADRREAARALLADTTFYVGYQGDDVRPLQTAYGAWTTQVVSAAFPEIAPRVGPARTRGVRKLRVGYVSGFLNRHTVADLWSGWLIHADRSRFDVHAYHLGRESDFMTERLREAADVFRHVPDGIDAASRAIIDDELDVLVYLDIGMFPAASALASRRLAPVQCTTWGHPITSGLAAIDYYISSDLMEPDGAEREYSERLVALPKIGISYPKPARPASGVTRADLGVDAGATVFLSCQSPYKYLPQYDWTLIQLAERVPRAVFVFVHHMGAGALERRIRAAFETAGLDASARCRFLPVQSQSDFLRLMCESDVFLDTIGWNGAHSTLEAIAMELPVVTCPRGAMRGRHSAAMLTVLGVTDTIAASEQDYVDIASRLAVDATLRAGVRRRMAANHARLFDDLECVRALESFYARAIEGIPGRSVLRIQASEGGGD